MSALKIVKLRILKIGKPVRLKNWPGPGPVYSLAVYASDCDVGQPEVMTLGVTNRLCRDAFAVITSQCLGEYNLQTAQNIQGPSKLPPSQINVHISGNT